LTNKTAVKKDTLLILRIKTWFKINKTVRNKRATGNILKALLI
jgi:hypothetical protein